MLRVAKSTAQVAAAKAHENGRRSSVEAFALKGVECFVDFIHFLDCFVVPPRNDAKRMKG